MWSTLFYVDHPRFSGVFPYDNIKFHTFWIQPLLLLNKLYIHTFCCCLLRSIVVLLLLCNWSRYLILSSHVSSHPRRVDGLMGWGVGKQNTQIQKFVKYGIKLRTKSPHYDGEVCVVLVVTVQLEQKLDRPYVQSVWNSKILR